MKKIVIKIGSSSLINTNRQLCKLQMIEIVRQLAHLHNKGFHLILVSSGAIAAAREDSRMKTVGTCMPSKQMLASIGQVKLMQTWSELFQIYGVTIGQILLTNEDISNKKRSENAQNTFQALLDHQVIPVVNENDTVATEEICFGENDTLSAQVAKLIQADHLILLTDQDGLYTHDPRFHPEAQLIESIEIIDEAIHSCAGESTNPEGIGTGGMATKVKAAKIATQAGTKVTIAAAKEPNVIVDLVAGKKIGTTFQI